MKNSVTWKIGGEAGFGIISSGLMLCRTFSRVGYHVLATNEYPSLIRGGHNLVTVRIGTEKFTSLNKDLHILVALNKETVLKHKNEMSSGDLIIFDPKDYVWQTSELPQGVVLVSVPLSDLVQKFSGTPVMRNTVALGATVALMGADFSKLESVIKDQFVKKGEKVISENLAIAKAGFNHIKTGYQNEQSMYLAVASAKEPQLVINGSEIVGIAAVRAGLKFAAIYPMTPINSLITYLADHAKEVQVVYKQPEDEIAGINMAIGASITGARSMVATSGGGFALMTEGLALAGMIEAPLVIDLGMRVGPATGMPTWTEQGELQFAIHAGHGEFPRVVLAPSNAEEAFDLTVLAFHLADKYQLQVILLTDKYLNESQWCVAKSHLQKPVTGDRGKLASKDQLAAGSFKRFDLTSSDGVSARSFPGTPGGFYINTSYEHDESGFVTEDPAQRQKMADKRLRKLKAVTLEALPPVVLGDQNPELTLVTWGTSAGICQEAAKILRTQGRKVQVVYFPWIYPFPSDQTVEILKKGGRLASVEQNGTGQLASLIREHTGLVIEKKLLKYDGRPFFPEEIVTEVNQFTN